MNDRERELEKLIKLKAVKERERLAEETRKEEQAKIAQLAARNNVRSGGTVKLVIDFALQRSMGGASADYQAFKDVYGRAGLLTPDGLRERGKKAVAQITGKSITAHVNNYAVTKGIIPEDAVDKMVSSEIETMKHRFLRDIEIDAVNLETQPRTDVQTAAALSPATDYDVFVSFATPDREIAEEVTRLLEAQGLRVFFSPKELEGGDSWEEKIRIALVGSGELCLIISKASLNREWVLTEWGAAWATKKRIAPVLVDVDVKDLHNRLQSNQCVRLAEIGNYFTQAAKRLLRRAASNGD
jgi:hypothetical protein